MKIIVSSRNSLMSGIRETEDPISLVSITDKPTQDIAKQVRNFRKHDSIKPYIAILSLSFDDIEFDGKEFFGNRKMISFTQDMANLARAFIQEGLEDGRSIIFQCEAGISRSAAMAAATARFFGRPWEDLQFFQNYIPNRLVYRLMLQSFSEKEESSNVK